MKARYRLIRRGNRSGAFYCVDTETGKRSSRGVSSENDALQIVEAKNQARRQPMLNLQIAKAYLAGTDSAISTRTWQQAIEALTNTKHDANRIRWQGVLKDPALAPLWSRVIIETPGELLLKILQLGTISTNVFLRRLHNFCVDMNWLPWPLIPKRQWPTVRFKEKRAITSFKKRCVGLGIHGISLHSYRYAWAERTKVAGYPERFAQESLGHSSKAVHRAYARKAQVLLPPLEDYEREQRQKVVPFSPHRSCDHLQPNRTELAAVT